MRILFARHRAGDDAPHESGGASSILTSLWVHAETEGGASPSVPFSRTPGGSSVKPRFVSGCDVVRRTTRRRRASTGVPDSDSAHPDAPRVDGRPDPDGEQQTQEQDCVGSDRSRRQRHEVGGDHSAYEPAQRATGDQQRSTLERLAIVELTKSGKDTGQKERNDCSTSSGRVGH